MMSTDSLHYIVMLHDSHLNSHDGCIFNNINDAREFIKDCIADKYCESGSIGTFVYEPYKKSMLINSVESFTTKPTGTKIQQLDIFKDHY